MAYVTLEEFVRLLRLEPEPTAEALANAQAKLDTATAEIDSYLGWTDSSAFDALTTDQQALVKTVNLERAGEHWRGSGNTLGLAFGVLNQGPETMPVLTARNSWYRHAQKLLPLKTAWGIG